jgi:hypothetical protein
VWLLLKKCSSSYPPTPWLDRSTAYMVELIKASKDVVETGKYKIAQFILIAMFIWTVNACRVLATRSPECDCRPALVSEQGSMDTRCLASTIGHALLI